MSKSFEKDQLLRELDQSDKSHIVKKQDRFDINVTEKLLRGIEPYSGYATEAIRTAGDDLGCAWFNEWFPSFPVKLATLRLPKGIPVPKIMKKFEDTRLRQAFESWHAPEPFE